MAAPPELGLLRMLLSEIDRLQNAVQHLLQSNADLKVAIEEEGDEDREFKQAIEVTPPACRRCRCPAALHRQPGQSMNPLCR